MATPSGSKSASSQIDAIIREAGDWRGEALSRLRDLVMGAGPDVVEEVKWKKPSRPEGVPVWSHDGIVCAGEMLKNAVRLTFPKGAQMTVSKSLFNARLDSNSVRAIDFSQGEAVPEAALKALIVEAVGLNARSLQAASRANGKELHEERTKKQGPAYSPAINAAGRRPNDGTSSPLARYSGSSSSGRVPGGTVHKLPPDLHKALVANTTALDAWVQITPLARNEFICWVEDAKQETTRQRRIRRTEEELEEGQRRPCCWPGCRHRERTGR
jgi:hypothetical protein